MPALIMGRAARNLMGDALAWTGSETEEARETRIVREALAWADDPRRVPAPDLVSLGIALSCLNAQRESLAQDNAALCEVVDRQAEDLRGLMDLRVVFLAKRAESDEANDDTTTECGALCAAGDR